MFANSCHADMGMHFSPYSKIETSKAAYTSVTKSSVTKSLWKVRLNVLPDHKDINWSQKFVHPRLP